MTKDEIKKRLEARPFIPFKVKIAGGDVLHVPTADHAHLNPSGRTLFIHLDEGGTEIVSVALISSLKLPEVA
jgi:hypothetical protein